MKTRNLILIAGAALAVSACGAPAARTMATGAKCPPAYELKRMSAADRAYYRDQGCRIPTADKPRKKSTVLASNAAKSSFSKPKASKASSFSKPSSSKPSRSRSRH